jgi:hypothetical protein
MSALLNTLRSRHMQISVGEEGVTVRYDPPWTMTLGSKTRTKDLRARLRIRFRLWDPAARFNDGRTYQARFSLTEIERARSAIRDIDHVLDAFSTERLTPKIVEEILGITAGERIRWNKEGRLPRSGTGTFKKGRQVFQFSLHPVNEIAKLAADPSIIENWRGADKRNRSAS